ncbi:MAG: complex I NDUFA9 subunit family protein [Pelagibacteraceae bacterium]|jgi:NADH dehydrogenase|nr:complex I NDUFA9 subunit family protein [Pelagibacteraceae bacterium]|tara:strand:+ start:4429 stop:5379 length:951 start_codon:yes stop_codon:yes gene_type:complete
MQKNLGKVACIFGASGFIGRHLIRRLIKKGFRIIAVTRSPYLHGHLKPLGNPGQIDLEKVNLFDEERLRILIKSSDVVINLVGILYETKKQKFEDIHAKFPDLLSKLCSELNIKKLVHISALGINETVSSQYMQSKLKGEKNIINNFNCSVILRPSVIFGPEDKFFNRFASIAEFLPILPLIGGGLTYFQPIYVGDIAKSIMAVLEEEEINNNIFELGGPQIITYKELMKILLKEINKKRFLVPIPFPFAKFQAKILQLLPKPLLTVDQIEMLKYDNIVTNKYPTLKDLKINPKTIESVLPNYIWRFRKGGQFAKL